ncbi:Haem-binding domain-containing protein [Flavobacterium fryxellicola]|uniref:Cytochrome C n=1 Tax=Flavobacterium fryxellicola TaxID=249352 RepID=A0A167X787_9FLAO|nr:heme-binding domain-containing protein [Flavobacterium fryxellicola]OAB28078.1 cytochrome C [Flavobacterium fryxellicola]SHN64153.1 Haem-binding domain-containing protein [Flavobacterium fryxellicola]
MKPIIKKGAILSVVLFLLMQLYQPARNVEYGQVSPMHFTKLYKVPSRVEKILQISCFDCHSNSTNYPWYSYVQPVRLFLDSHINEGKENLNFSEYGTYSKRKQRSKLDRMIKQIQSDEMPLASYTIIHKNARLTKESKAVLLNWIEKKSDSIAANN